MPNEQPKKNRRGPLSASAWQQMEQRWQQQRLVSAKHAELEARKAAKAKPIAPIIQRDILLTRRFGKPSGRPRRPPGTLSVLDIMSKYKITNRTLIKWRKQGLPAQQIGRLIVIKERDLKRWIRQVRSSEVK